MMAGNNEPSFPMGESRRSLFFNRVNLGCTAAVLTAIPLSLGITVFDNAVSQVTKINGAGGKGNLLKELRLNIKLLRRPYMTFMSEANLAVYAVYAPTYIVRSITEHVCIYYDIDKKIPLMIFPFLVNCPLSIRKDKILAQLCMKPGEKCVFLPKTISWLLTRDFIVTTVSFVGPEYLSPMIQDKLNWSEKAAISISTLLCPALAQIPATFFHLSGLDTFYRPSASIMDNLKLAFRSARGVIVTRMLRQGYAYGVGTLFYREVDAFLQAFNKN